jgi:hypothetical protein
MIEISCFILIRVMTEEVSDIKQESNPWTKRFIAAAIIAIIQGAIIVGLTAFLVLSQISLLKPEISRVIAARGAGTWFTFGYIIQT